MKRILVFLALFPAAVLSQSLDLNADEYMSWKVNYTPYKIKAVQAINDYRSLSNDTTVPRARFQDDLIIIQSRISGDIEQVWFGNRTTALFVLTRGKVHAVFSRSFIETILDRDQYYYLNFDAFGDKNSVQKTLDYLYSTWWGSHPQNELNVSAFRLLLYMPTSDLHFEASMGDEYIGLPGWTGGFSRVGLVHTSFRFGVQMGNAFTSPFGGQRTLNGAWGGYGALNLENLRIGIASAYRPEWNFDNSVTDKEDIRYAGLMIYATYSPLIWNRSWGAGRVWLGFNHINLYNVRETANGVQLPRIVPPEERASPGDSLRSTNRNLLSPVFRIEYVSAIEAGKNSTLESYLQFANFAATASFTMNFGENIGAGAVAHYNVTERNGYSRGWTIFPTVRVRF